MAGLAVFAKASTGTSPVMTAEEGTLDRFEKPRPTHVRFGFL
jgi:hypothetical protein